MRFSFLMAATMLSLTTSPGKAALVDKHFQLTASNFTHWAFAIAPEPNPILNLTFSVKFDTGANVNSPSDGSDALTVHSSNVALPWSLGYDSFGGRLSIATYAFPGGCVDLAPSTYCIFISDIGTIPKLDYVQQVTPSGGLWIAQKFALTEITAPPVPEPASWAMMICGFALAGTSMRARANWRVSVVK